MLFFTAKQRENGVIRNFTCRIAYTNETHTGKYSVLYISIL